MKRVLLSIAVIAIFSMGSISCDMGSDFDEVVVNNSVQDQTSPSSTEDQHLPVPGEP